MGKVTLEFNCDEKYLVALKAQYIMFSDLESELYDLMALSKDENDLDKRIEDCLKNKDAIARLLADLVFGAMD